MKVAVVTDYFPTSVQPWAGHSAYQTLRLLVRLCKVHVFYPQAVYPAFAGPKYGKVDNIDPAWHPPDVPATYIQYPAVPVLSRPFNGFVSARRLLPAVRAYAPEVILNYSVYPYGLAAVLIGRALRVPVVLTAIGSDLNRMSDPLCALLTRYTLRHADFVTTVSQDLCRTALRLGAPLGMTRSKLNGCDRTVFHNRDRPAARRQLGLAADAEIVLYVGRLDVRKGLTELVEAMALLRAERPRAICMLVGDGPDKPILDAAIARLGLADTVLFQPPCQTEQIAVWMAAADLVTLPSYAEGCPNVIIEALASGRPVVASNVGGIPELLHDKFGRLVPPRAAAALARGLNETLSQPWDNQWIADKNDRDWTEVALDLHECFDDLIR